MKAVVFDTFQGPITVERVAEPTPPEDGVVVRVRATGICRSDWHGWMGHDADVRLPHVPGHELAGTIEAVGREVRRWRPGERVTVPFAGGCGRCDQCAAGQQQICDHYFQPGFTGWGSFAEYVALRYADVNLVRLPEAMSFVEAAALGCRLTTAFRAVVAQGRVQAGDWVAVLGCGGVGLSAVMIAAAAGARVIAVDIKAEALDLARMAGAQFAVNAHEVADVVAAIHDLSGGGAHLALDALGSPTTCRQSILALRKRGRQVQVGLMLGEDRDPPVPMGAVISKELEILGSHGLQAHEYPRLFDMMAAGVIQPGRLVSRTISLEEAPAALAGMGHFQESGILVVELP